MSVSNLDERTIADAKTTIAFWCGLGCGAASWVTFGFAYRFVIESLKIGPPPSYAYALGPMTLVFGITAFGSLAYGFKRRARHPKHRWTTARFLVAGIPSCFPAAVCILGILSQLWQRLWQPCFF